MCSARNALTVALLALATVVSATLEHPIIYEATRRYNVLPWEFTMDKLFAFAVTPLKKPPTNPLTYPGYPQWPFQAGPGYLVCIKFSDSPIGAYSEIFYIPGLYKPACSLKAYFSVQRIWVDSPYSRHAGRTIWGIPKELATFDWKEGSGALGEKWTSVSLTDNRTGVKFFSANMTDLEMGPGVPLPSWLLPSNIRTVVQWPIDDAKHTYLSSAKEYASTPIAKFTNMKTPAVSVNAMKPVLTTLNFDGEDATVATAKDVTFDAEAFTGDKNAKVGIIPLAIHLKAGTKATLSEPKVLHTC